jgi:hypothetical protein
VPDMETSVNDSALSGAGISQQPQNGAREKESRAAPKELLNISSAAGRPAEHLLVALGGSDDLLHRIDPLRAADRKNVLPAQYCKALQAGALRYGLPELPSRPFPLCPPAVFRYHVRAAVAYGGKKRSGEHLENIIAEEDRGRELPRQVGGYLLLEKIGSGPRGAVYRAESQREPRRVALKLLEPGLEVDLALLERFSKASPARIRHPNLFAVEAAGKEEERFFYATCLLGGDSLRDILDDIRRGSSDRPSLCPLAVAPGGELHPAYHSQIAQLLGEVAAGLEEAHRAGICHFRLSPANLIFSGAGRLVITDFGGSPAAAADPPEVLRYRAPEQLLADAAGAGPASDVYALGSILFELVTFEPLFPSLGAAALKKAILEGRFPPPRTVRRQVPAPLEAIILQSLSRNPEERYLSAGELAEDLGRFLRAEAPLALQRREVEEQAAQSAPPRRRLARRLAAAGAMAALLAAAALAGGKLQLSGGKESARVEALRHLNAGLHARARSESERLIALDPAGPALRESIAGAAAAEHLLLAARALHESNAPSALAELTEAGRLLPATPALEELRREIAADASRPRPDPLALELEDDRPAVRLEALYRLRQEIAGCKRPAADLRLVTLALFDAEPAIRRLAFELFVLGGESAPLLDVFGLTAGGGDCRLDGAGFLLFHRALARIADPPALELLCQWSLPLLEELDRLPAPTLVHVPPRLEVELRHDTPRHFAAAWIAAAPAIDPAALIAAAPAFGERGLHLSALIEALAAIGTPEAAERLAALARCHPLSHGREALQALGRMRALPALLRLVRSPLPAELQLQALALCAADPAQARPALAKLLESSPEPAVRRAAFELLAAGAGDWDPTAPLLAALEDTELRRGALDWLSRLDPPRRSAISLALLPHRSQPVRRRAIELLAADARPELFQLLAAKLLSSHGAARRAALEAIIARRDLERTASSLGALAARRLDGLKEDLGSGAELLRQALLSSATRQAAARLWAALRPLLDAPSEK